jgi:tellurite methyltransferase
VGEERDKGREDAEGDVTPDVSGGGGAQPDDDGGRQSEERDADGSEKRLSHESQYHASPFVVQWVHSIAPMAPSPRRALDVAMGRGRHAAILARAELRTFGVDMAFESVHEAVVRAAGAGLTVRGWCADLTRSPLPAGRFELVLVTRYLQRDLFPSIRAAVVRGGYMLYETFTVRQRAFGVGPASPDHLLNEGELRARFDDWDLVYYEEVVAAEAVARLVARKKTQG